MMREPQRIVEAPLDRVRSIERRQLRAGIGAATAAVGYALLLFAAFAAGHMLGPTPLAPLEAVLGASGCLLVGLLAARPLARRRREAGATSRWDLMEGSGRRRVLVFEGHVLLDQEVVLKESVERVERSGDALLVRYQDPVAAGPLLRELSGNPRGLDAVADALAPIARAGG